MTLLVSHSGDGRKTSHRFSRAKEDNISVREVFKNELGRKAGILGGSTVGQSVGPFVGQSYFLFFFGYKLLVL
jgi:hypothetical protein